MNKNQDLRTEPIYFLLLALLASISKDFLEKKWKKIILFYQ